MRLIIITAYYIYTAPYISGNSSTIRYSLYYLSCTAQYEIGRRGGELDVALSKRYYYSDFSGDFSTRKRFLSAIGSFAQEPILLAPKLWKIQHKESRFFDATSFGGGEDYNSALRK